MDELYQVCESLSGLTISERWRMLLDLYAVITNETQQFQQEYSVWCDPGCGTCCERFVPELTSLEASLIAAYMLFVQKDNRLIESLKQSDETLLSCPLYRAEGPYHCTVYPARGMICRLFGVCPSSDKSGVPVFRRCAYNKIRDLHTVAASHGMSFAGRTVPTMHGYALRFYAIEQDQMTKPIGMAVYDEIERLRFVTRYFDFPTDDGNDSGSPDNAPIAC